jgi:methylthioribose-1-phosphate isomerase
MAAKSPELVPVWWEGDAVGYIDQRRLPASILRARAESVDDVVAAIASLAVRGAPCIGAFGAYGVALARRQSPSDEAFASAAARIRAARPTAVNLSWAVDRVLAAERGEELAEAHAILDEQRMVDRAIADHAIPLFPNTGAVLTHCNTGPLATGGFGTALGAIVAAARAGKRLHVYVDETRPLLQGARLTTVELAAAGVPATLIVDGAAAATMRTKRVMAVIVGADRIAANGDTANKIGTYGLAVAAAHHAIPFYVAAPRSTIDFSLADGDGIAIEERDPDEVRAFRSAQAAPEGFDAYNPAFDVTPGHLIAAIVTEYGVARPPYVESIPDIATRPRFALVNVPA